MGVGVEFQGSGDWFDALHILQLKYMRCMQSKFTTTTNFKRELGAPLLDTPLSPLGKNINIIIVLTPIYMQPVVYKSVTFGNLLFFKQQTREDKFNLTILPGSKGI